MNAVVNILRILLVVSVAWLASVAVGVRAQQAGHASGFTTTQYCEAPHQQQVESILSGAEALPQAGGLLIIKQLELKTFDTNGNIKIIVTAPECIYDTMGGTASSGGPLHLQNGDGRFSVDGEGFLWRRTDQFLTISNRVRTRIENGGKTNFKP